MGLKVRIPTQEAHRQLPTSEPLQPPLLPLFAYDEEQSHPQCGQDDRAADGEQLLHVIPLTLSRLDGRDGTCVGVKKGVGCPL